MISFDDPGLSSVLTLQDRSNIYLALIESTRRNTDPDHDKKWILSRKVRCSMPLDEEELEMIVTTLRERANRSERNGMILNPLFDRILADKVASIKDKREQQMIEYIQSRYKEKTACSQQTALNQI